MQHVSRRFGAIRAVDDISLDFPAGSFTALLGPSGCGKSTLLRLIAGFEAPDAGDIHFGGRLVSDPGRQVPPEERGVGIVFQSYALWPHMDVAGNVAYPAEDPRRRSPDDRCEGGGRARHGRARWFRRTQGGRALRRAAAARGARALPCRRRQDHPFRRAARQSRHASARLDGRGHSAISTGASAPPSSMSRTIRPRRWPWPDRVAVLDRGRLLQVAPPARGLPFTRRRQGRGFRRARDPRLGACRPGCRWQGRCGDRRTSDRGAQHGEGRRRVAFGAAAPGALALGEAGLPAIVAATTYRGPVHELRLRLETGEELVLDHPRAPAMGTASASPSPTHGSYPKINCSHRQGSTPAGSLAEKRSSTASIRITDDDGGDGDCRRMRAASPASSRLNSTTPSVSLPLDHNSAETVSSLKALMKTSNAPATAAGAAKRRRDRPACGGRRLRRKRLPLRPVRAKSAPRRWRPASWRAQMTKRMR